MNKEALENLQTSQLDEMLQAELRKDRPNGDLVRLIVSVLKKRDKDQAVEITPEVQAAWDKLNKKHQRRTERVTPTARNWVRRTISLASAAVFVCAIFLLIVPEPAKADHWWEKAFSWSKDLFTVRNPGEEDPRQTEYVFKTDNEGLQEVYDAVARLGVTVPVVPMWLPAGYTLNECEVSSGQAQKVIYADFYKGDSSIVFQAEVFERGVRRQYQKDESAEVTQYEISGVVFHVMKNNSRLIAVWTNENIESSLSTDGDEKEFYEILNSIYNMEG